MTELYNPPLLHPAYKRYQRRRPEMWEAARAAFEAGSTAGEVCERFGLGRSQLYERARRENWVRTDQLEPADLLAELTDIGDDGPLPGPDALARDAYRQAARAVALGRLAEARGWARLVRDFRTLAVARSAHPDKADEPDVSGPESGSPDAAPGA